MVSSVKWLIKSYQPGCLLPEGVLSKGAGDVLSEFTDIH